MAIDTVFKRCAATLLFPQAKAVWPAGDVDRQAAAWVYSGIGAGAAAEVPGTPELRRLTTQRRGNYYTTRRGADTLTTHRTPEANSTRRR